MGEGNCQGNTEVPKCSDAGHIAIPPNNNLGLEGKIYDPRRRPILRIWSLGDLEIIGVSKQAGAGIPVAGLCVEHRMGSALLNQ